MSENLHPLFAEILRPVLRATEDVKAAEVFYPSVGNLKRPYRSVGDAFAYEAGYLHYRDGAPAPERKTPYADGWWDAFAAAESAAWASLDRKFDNDDEVAA